MGTRTWGRLRYVAVGACVCVACASLPSQGDGGGHDDAAAMDAAADAVADATADAYDANACATCSGTLTALCAADPSACPPGLDDPGFDAWARAQIGPSTLQAPSCFQDPECPELLMLVFWKGVDCSSDYLFDVSTRRLVGVLHSCNSLNLNSCLGLEGCVPLRCMPRNIAYKTPASCPVLPRDGGPG